LIATSLEVERMTHLIKELLLLTRIENDEKLQNVTVIDSNDLMHKVLSLYKNAALAKQITFSSDLTNFRFPGNQDLLVIALGNLLDNAIKFSSYNSSVDLAVRKIGNKIEFTFINSGVTIPTEKLTHLFERFYQTEINHSIHGYGLGLAITRQIIKLHHGNVDITSNNSITTVKTSFPLNHVN
ncbi:MAG: sensor histidine kinase, partial [Candidatus Saccharibacteria bacterium]|nr:sensor histidine kinase [Candidatus Saccharibacteria bacterium]